MQYDMSPDDEIAAKIVTSNIVVASHEEKETDVETMPEIIKKITDAKKSFILTAVPLLKTSSDTTTQTPLVEHSVTHINALLTLKDATLFALTQEKVDAQKDIKAEHHWDTIKLLSDPDLKLKEVWDLPTVQDKERSYYDFFTIVVRPDGRTHAFRPTLQENGHYDLEKFTTAIHAFINEPTPVEKYKNLIAEYVKHHHSNTCRFMHNDEKKLDELVTRYCDLTLAEQKVINAYLQQKLAAHNAQKFPVDYENRFSKFMLASTAVSAATGAVLTYGLFSSALPSVILGTGAGSIFGIVGATSTARTFGPDKEAAIYLLLCDQLGVTKTSTLESAEGLVAENKAEESSMGLKKRS